MIQFIITFSALTALTFIAFIAWVAVMVWYGSRQQARRDKWAGDEGDE